jgi:hypothetical protein
MRVPVAVAVMASMIRSGTLTPTLSLRERELMPRMTAKSL